MFTAITILRMLLRTLLVVMIVLGGMIWGNHANLVNLHVQIGFAFALTLLLLVVIGAARRVSPGLLVGGLIWALLLPVFGFAQRTMMPGSAHWIVQVLHLIIGVGAVGLGEVIGKRASALPTA